MNLLKRAWDATTSSRTSRTSVSRDTVLALATAELRTASRSSRARGLVLLDGRSGSGKTSFALELQKAAPSASVLHLDDLYPDWDGLEDGIRRAEQLVAAWSRGESATFAPTQWPGTPPRGDQTLDPGRLLIVEGVGARRALADPGSTAMPLTIYLDLPSTLRRERALARDGAVFAPHWESWAAQEDDDLSRHPLRAHDPDVLICHDSSFGETHA